MPIEPLHKSHTRGDFDCGEPSLNLYIQTQARQHTRYGYADTFVLIEEGAKNVIGYYAVLPSSVEGALFPEDVNVPSLLIPIVLLGKLAVDNRYQGRRFGEELLLHSLKYAVDFASQYPCVAVCLDALNEDKRRFYAKYGFASLSDNPLHMFIAMKAVRKLGL